SLFFFRNSRGFKINFLVYNLLPGKVLVSIVILIMVWLTLGDLVKNYSQSYHDVQTPVYSPHRQFHNLISCIKNFFGYFVL
ncbi:MAG: hypothetical protein AAB874_02420, partial [Patescibacteria group bacterium]